VTSSGKGIVLTLGDPNGLGPELVCRVLPERPETIPILLVGPEEPLLFHCRRMGVQPFWHGIGGLDLHGGASGVLLYTPPTLLGAAFDPGRPTREGGRCAGESLEAALAVLGASIGWTLVTAPLNKAMLQEAGFAFPGHTEFLAERSGVGRESVCMHLWGPRLRVSLATTHPALKDVPGMIRRERLMVCMRLTCRFVRALGHREPVAVCGLNPHAGEQGRIGREEIEVIGPAVREAQSEGLDVQGPFPGDTVFHRAAQGAFSAVLAMYHDQGLAPLKLLHFGEAVNVTLGLPFVRTSVDHGTGYDLVGTGKANPASLRAALELALRLSGTNGSPS
jgi:4-hydroxythreonine-4-phosphate dehydrogenase